MSLDGLDSGFEIVGLVGADAGLSDSSLRSVGFLSLLFFSCD